MDLQSKTYIPLCSIFRDEESQSSISQGDIKYATVVRYFNESKEKNSSDDWYVIYLVYDVIGIFRKHKQK